MRRQRRRKHLTVHDIKFKDMLKTSKGTILEVAFPTIKYGWVEIRLKPRKKKQ